MTIKRYLKFVAYTQREEREERERERDEGNKNSGGKKLRVKHQVMANYSVVESSATLFCPP